MSTLVLSIGIAVTFLTVWGVVMVGSYLLQGDTVDEPLPLASNWVTQAATPPGGESSRTT